MDILPSLGASGAIYAAVTLTALAYPDAVVSLIFPPTWPIPIQWGVGALVLVDVFGVLRGWRYISTFFIYFRETRLTCSRSQDARSLGASGRRGLWRSVLRVWPATLGLDACD